MSSLKPSGNTRKHRETGGTNRQKRALAAKSGRKRKQPEKPTQSLVRDQKAAYSIPPLQLGVTFAKIPQPYRNWNLIQQNPDRIIGDRGYWFIAYSRTFCQFPARILFRSSTYCRKLSRPCCVSSQVVRGFLPENSLRTIM